MSWHLGTSGTSCTATCVALSKICVISEFVAANNLQASSAASLFGIISGINGYSLQADVTKCNPNSGLPRPQTRDNGSRCQWSSLGTSDVGPDGHGVCSTASAGNYHRLCYCTPLPSPSPPPPSPPPSPPPLSPPPPPMPLSPGCFELNGYCLQPDQPDSATTRYSKFNSGIAFLETTAVHNLWNARNGALIMYSSMPPAPWTVNVQMKFGGSRDAMIAAGSRMMAGLTVYRGPDGSLIPFGHGMYASYADS